MRMAMPSAMRMPPVRRARKTNSPRPRPQPHPRPYPARSGSLIQAEDVTSGAVAVVVMPVRSPTPYVKQRVATERTAPSAAATAEQALVYYLRRP